MFLLGASHHTPIFQLANIISPYFGLTPFLLYDKIAINPIVGEMGESGYQALLSYVSLLYVKLTSLSFVLLIS